MNAFYKTVASVIAIVWASSVAAQGAAPLSDEAKARRAIDNARNFEQNARTLTVFDRQGKRLNTVGTRALYGNPVFSRDGTKLAYNKRDLEQENADLWVLDLATGKEIQLTHGKMREQISQAVWSPDGRQVVYTALRDGKYGVYRRAADGEGAEELLYSTPGIAVPTDWSADGRTLSLGQGDLGGSIVSSFELDGSSPPKITEIFRSPKQVQPERLSPDGRLIAYVSNESGKNEVYVRPFSPGASTSGTNRCRAASRSSRVGGAGMSASVSRRRRSRPVSRILCAALTRRRRPSLSVGRSRARRVAVRPRRAATRELGRAALERSLLALLRTGVAEPRRSPAALVGSYPTVSPLPLRRSAEAVCFLLPLREVAPAWLSPASCPAESGLSSPRSG